MEKIIASADGNQHQLFLTQSGKVFSQGDNKKGQLGDGSFDRSSTPIRVLGILGKARTITAGGEFSRRYQYRFPANARIQETKD